MKVALIIVSIVAVLIGGVLIWQMIEKKKIVAANKVLDPNKVITPAVVTAIASPTTTISPMINAPVAESLARLAMPYTAQ